MVLVTGGTGLVGSHLLLELTQSGQSVRALYRNINTTEKTKRVFANAKQFDLFEKIEWVCGDITDIPSLTIALQRVTMVYHAAATISFDPKDQETLYKNNIEGTANLVNLCLAHKIKRIGYVSSIAALGDVSEPDGIVDEETPWNPEKHHSDYAISKYGAQMEIWRGLQEGLEVVIVNPGVIVAPNYWKEGSGALVPKLLSQQWAYTKGSTGFVTVFDVVKAFHLLMQSESNAAQQYILVGQNITYRKLLCQLCIWQQKPIPRFYLRPTFTLFISRIDWIITSLFFFKRNFPKSIAKSLHSNVLYSSKKIEHDFHYKFQDVLDYLHEEYF